MFQLQKDLASVSQGSQDVSGYFTRIKRLWDELNAVDVIPVCTCGAATTMLKREQDRRLIQFRMGLNEQFQTVRGNVHMMSPLPNISQAYSLLIQEEKQREIQQHHIS